MSQLPPSIPPAPWHLTGQAVAFLAAPFKLRLLVNYATSPVGPYLEHALAVPTWRGPRVGQMSVDSNASVIGGREIWGYPKTLEMMQWQQTGARFRFRCMRRMGETSIWFKHSEGVQSVSFRSRHMPQIFRWRTFGPTIPIALPFWTVQTLDGADVRVPAKIRARVQLAFRGRQLAIFVESFTMIFDPPQPL